MMRSDSSNRNLVVMMVSPFFFSFLYYCITCQLPHIVSVNF